MNKKSSQNNRWSSTQIDDIKLGEIIGRYRYSEYRRAFNSALNIPITVKKVSKLSLQMLDKKETLTKEIGLLSELSHRGILRFVKALEDEENFYLLFDDSVTMSLAQFMKKSKSGTILKATIINTIRQLLKAVSYLHRCRVVHQDINPENIIFCGQV